MTNKGSLEDAVQGQGVHVDSDNRICWDEDANQHPRNWNFGTKTYTAALICWLEMYMTAISSSGTATADSAREEYGVSRTMAYFVFVTMRWVYYISTIVTGVTAVACIFTRESNANQLLDKIVKEIREETGIEDVKSSNNEGEKFAVATFAQNALFRPLQFLVTDPLVFFCAVLCAIAFGLIYGLTESLTIVYTAPPFNFSQNSSSLAFLAIAIGEVLNILPRVYDAHIYKKYRRTHRRILPESKITSFAIAAPSLAIGLWLFAWTIPPRVTNVPWPVSMIGLVMIGFSLNDFSYVLFGYATDSYGEYAASAVSAISLTRTLTAAVFPLFTHQMYTGLGSNVATSILAAVASLFAFTPFLFLRYGSRLRHRSKFAADDEQALEQENLHMEDKD
ncbi:multidrug resistant [Fusarium acutatum]|uniref:Multidrug resistant n=1 Tax=Fusarium acutatum TaxID=78861 RepID=A0A8H4NLT6_9HYPO|nr:multidrug resistant [Fusarium acutatum]